MDNFFEHENANFPPALSDNGQLRLPTKKSDLLACLDTGQTPDPPPRFEAIAADGPPIVHRLPASPAETFEEFASKKFVP